MALESTITSSIIKYLNSLPYGRAEKVKGSSSGSGKADVNACYRGRSLRIEVKTADHRNTSSMKQNHNLEKWRKAGAVVMVVYSKEAVIEFLDRMDEGFTGAWELQEENGCVSWADIPRLR